MKSKLLVNAPNESLSSAPLDMAILHVLNSTSGTSSLEQRKAQYQDVLMQFGTGEPEKLTLEKAEAAPPDDPKPIPDPAIDEPKTARKTTKKKKKEFKKQKPYWLP